MADNIFYVKNQEKIKKTKAKNMHLNTRGFGGLPLTVLSPCGSVFLSFASFSFFLRSKRKKMKKR